MANFGVQQARERILDTMYAGKWDAAAADVEAYGAAVRAEERFRALRDALDALKQCADEDPSRTVESCIDAVRRLQ